MTHEYTILFGGTVLAGAEAPVCSAICWAHDTVLLLGTDAEARAVSRGDSHFIDLHGAFVVPLEGKLEVGGPADLAVVASDPRVGAFQTLATVRSGRFVDKWPAGYDAAQAVSDDVPH
ncbi:MAG: hypothetical protein ABI725_00495 [Chloroflexota bacterium]